jgi:hypothetical protein
MKTIGTMTLPQQFQWTPHQLLSMIKEIDRICPEEGALDPLTLNANTQALTINISE